MTTPLGPILSMWEAEGNQARCRVRCVRRRRGHRRTALRRRGSGARHRARAGATPPRRGRRHRGRARAARRSRADGRALRTRRQLFLRRIAEQDRVHRRSGEESDRLPERRPPHRSRGAAQQRSLGEAARRLSRGGRAAPHRGAGRVERAVSAHRGDGWRRARGERRCGARHARARACATPDHPCRGRRRPPCSPSSTQPALPTCVDIRARRGAATGTARGKRPDASAAASSELSGRARSWRRCREARGRARRVRARRAGADRDAIDAGVSRHQRLARPERAFATSRPRSMRSHATICNPKSTMAPFLPTGTRSSCRRGRAKKNSPGPSLPPTGTAKAISFWVAIVFGAFIAAALLTWITTSMLSRNDGTDSFAVKPDSLHPAAARARGAGSHRTRRSGGASRQRPASRPQRPTTRMAAPVLRRPRRRFERHRRERRARSGFE